MISTQSFVKHIIDLGGLFDPCDNLDLNIIHVAADLATSPEGTNLFAAYDLAYTCAEWLHQNNPECTVEDILADTVHNNVPVPRRHLLILWEIASSVGYWESTDYPVDTRRGIVRDILARTINYIKAYDPTVKDRTL